MINAAVNLKWQCVHVCVSGLEGAAVFSGTVPEKDAKRQIEYHCLLLPEYQCRKMQQSVYVLFCIMKFSQSVSVSDGSFSLVVMSALKMLVKHCQLPPCSEARLCDSQHTLLSACHPWPSWLAYI